MSFNKLIDKNGTGFQCQHWYLSDIRINQLTKRARLVYSGFKTKQDRLDGNKPDQSIVYVIKNWQETTIKPNGNEKIVNHNDFNQLVPQELRQLIKAQAKDHVKNVAIQDDLKDAVDD